MRGLSKHLTSLLLLALAVGARGDITVDPPLPPPGKKAHRIIVPAPAPEAALADVRVRRGGSVEIPLQVFGVAGQPLTFRIRSSPRAGRLSAVRMAGPGAGVVIYQHSGEQDRRHDRFSFTARSGDVTSAAAEVNITIVDDPPALAVREELDFGTVRIGSATTREVVLENRGGGLLKGVATVEKPWEIDGKSSYSLRSGQEQSLRIHIAPEAEEAARGEIHYSSDPDEKTVLTANAEAAVAITPERLDLDASRAGVLTISNRTSEEIPVRLRLAGKLNGPERATLPPGGAVSVKIEADPGETGPIDGVVQVECPSFMADIDVHAAPRGPALRVSPQTLPFGRLEEKQQKMLLITNAGGIGTFVQVKPSPRLVIAAADSSFWLEPGAAREIPVAVDPLNAGSYHELLAVQTESQSLEIPVTAEVAHGRSSIEIVATHKSPPALFPFLPPAGKSAPATNTSRFKNIKVIRLTDATCDIAWRIPANTRAVYQIESLVPGTELGNAHWASTPNVALRDPRREGASASWIAHGVKLETDDVHAYPGETSLPMSAHLTGLSPGCDWMFRITATDGDTSESSIPITIHTPAPSLLTSTPVVTTLSVCLLIVLAGSRFNKRRPAPERDEDESPAPAPRGAATAGPNILELGPGVFEIQMEDAESGKKSGAARSSQP